MSKPVPSQASAVVIGGGVAGCSVAYHLAKQGWKDVVLLERKQLACGTTWHAAGLIGQLRATANMTKLARYTKDLYIKLEEETGVATGFRQLWIDHGWRLLKSAKEEIYRQASMARAFGVAGGGDFSAMKRKARYPHLNIDDVVTGAVYLPLDGWPGRSCKHCTGAGQGCQDERLAQRFWKASRLRIPFIQKPMDVSPVSDWSGRQDRMNKARLKRTMLSTVVACGPGKLGQDGLGSMCHCMHASTFYIVTENIRGSEAAYRSCGCPMSVPTTRKMPARCCWVPSNQNAKPWGMDGIQG